MQRHYSDTNTTILTLSKNDSPPFTNLYRSSDPSGVKEVQHFLCFLQKIHRTLNCNNVCIGSAELYAHSQE